MKINQLNIRVCEEQDKEQWISLNREFMAYEIQDAEFWNNTASNSDENFAQTFKEAFHHPELITLLMIEKEDGAIGFANVMTLFSVWSHGKALCLDDLYIKKEYRGNGVGRRVMKYIEEYGREHGFKRLQFQSEFTNPEAHKFYSKLGYTSESMNFYVRYL
ncbi:GNAT family N-acetyltransferase [Aminipila luticellarii]|uniref:GNAT family N-acetyltransferase n=1 Tax=Aminipila luticellarii TaxID=2507160 RepID=A0A410PUL6_9FIRM|nr:GNAT family N-acetyltransferase [Aminipila luticellarii]QAT42613.1 GNAT family N-acetyltransferase [Aminipila luticellarii]